MGILLSLFAFVKWEQYYWLLPWNRLGWSANLYENDWNDGMAPPIGTNEYDMDYCKRKGSRATFAMDHFTRAECRFGVAPGVLRTRLGYTGGRAINPSYYNRGDHFEAVDIEYDPDRISYKELLAYFWNGHDYTRNTKEQPSIIFYHDKQQEVVCRLSRQERQQYEEINLMAENPWPRKVATRIKKCKRFWPAEHYAQKHSLHWHLHLLEWLGIKTHRQLIWSTLAMRINSLFTGEVEQERIHAFLKDLKLPDELYNYVLYLSHYQEHRGAKTRTTGKQRFEEILI